MSFRLFVVVVAGMIAIPALLAIAAEQPAELLAEAPSEAINGSTGNGTQPPLFYAMDDSSNCQNCHAFYDPAHEIEPWDTWAGTMMAQATRDPLFWAALDVANNDALEDPDIPDDIGQFCLRCHTPVGWLEGRATPMTNGCGLEGWIDDFDGDFDGVTCHTCHRMMINDDPPMGEETFYLENGSYWIDDTDCGGQAEPCRRGPYDYPADGSREPDHPWAHSPYHESSNLCGTCHNVSSPAKNLLDAAGTDTGLAFPIERTHREWEASDFGPMSTTPQTCQACHMPDTTADPAFACFQSQLFSEDNNHTGDMPLHQFAGGNTWIPEVLKGEYSGLGIGDAFDRTRALALDMLQNRSAVVEVAVDAEVPEGEALNAQVKITNTSGHKLPTGYSEGRRMWINIEARDGQGNLIWESGAYEPTTGVLTEDPQAKVYRVEQGIWDRNGTNECDIVDGMSRPIFHFVLSDCIRLDNRIPPLGFSGASNPEIQPVGYTYPEEPLRPGVLVNYDTTDYSIPIPLGTEGPISVTASLHYQTASKEYIEFLLNEAVENFFPDDCTPRLGTAPEKSRGELMFDLWESYDRSPPVEMGMAAGESTVTTPLSLEVTGTIDDTQTVEACNTVALGPGLILDSNANLTVRAGVNVEMHPTVEVRAGARLAIEIVPGLCG